MDTRDAFLRDLEHAQGQERRFEDYLNSHHDVLTENSQDRGRFTDWDVKVTGVTKQNRVSTYEVKYNQNTYNNRVIIEYAKAKNGYQVPAGIGTSKAEYYVFTFENDNGFYLIRTSILKALIDDTNTFKELRFKEPYFLVLFPKDWLIQQCRLLTP